MAVRVFAGRPGAVILAQLKGDTTSLRGWMLEHHVIRPGFQASPPIVHHDSNLGYIAVEEPPTEAAEEMARLGPRVSPIVIAALRDKDRQVRIMAILACGKLRAPAAITPLAECMGNATRPDDAGNCDEIAQEMCLASLVEIGPEAFGPLMRVYRPSNHCERFGFQLPATLATSWGAAAVPAILKLLEDPDWIIRQYAADELGRLKDPRATDALIRHMKDAEEIAGVSAVKALGEIGDRKAVSSLLKTLKDTHVANRIRIAAGAALSRMARDEGPAFLLAMLKSSTSDDRIYSADELGSLRIKGTLDPLLSLLADHDWIVRFWAVRAIGNLRDPRAVPALRKLLNDPEPYLRQSAAEALEKLGDKHPAGPQPETP